MAPEADALPDMPTPARDLGFSVPVQLAMLLGVFLVLLTGLFRAIVITSDDPSEGLADTGVWFGWIAASILSLSLVAAGMTGKDAGTGTRAALILVGVYLFLQASDPSSGLLSLVSGFF